MKGRFVTLWDRVAAQGDVEEAFGKLTAMYSEPQRFYHDMDHIKECLVQLDNVKNLTLLPDLVELAIWYHDAIYDTRAGDNEEASARLAYNVLTSAQLPVRSAEEVRDLILATKHNEVPKSLDGKFFVDIDLAALGKPYEEFTKDTQKIREEYSWVSDSDFREGRAEILQGFLDRESIYLTEFFGSKYEERARTNLQKSIEALRSK